MAAGRPTGRPGRRGGGDPGSGPEAIEAVAEDRPAGAASSTADLVAAPDAGGRADQARAAEEDADRPETTGPAGAAAASLPEAGAPPADATGLLMASLGRSALSDLISQPGEVVASLQAGATVRARGLRSCRVERLRPGRPLAAGMGDQPAVFYRIVIDGDLATRSHPAEVWVDGQPLAVLHESEQGWVAISARTDLATAPHQIAIGYGPAGIVDAFDNPLRPREPSDDR